LELERRAAKMMGAMMTGEEKAAAWGVLLKAGAETLVTV
jgi:hypothetical protein